MNGRRTLARFSKTERRLSRSTTGRMPSVGLRGLQSAWRPTKVAVAALLDRLREGGKPGRQPDAETVEKIKQRKPSAIRYDDGKSVDPRRAAAYLEDKLTKRDRILVFDGG